MPAIAWCHGIAIVPMASMTLITSLTGPSGASQVRGCEIQRAPNSSKTPHPLKPEPCSRNRNPNPACGHGCQVLLLLSFTRISLEGLTSQAKGSTPQESLIRACVMDLHGSMGGFILEALGLQMKITTLNLKHEPLNAKPLNPTHLKKNVSQQVQGLMAQQKART